MEWVDIGLKCVEEAVKAIETVENSIIKDRDNILTKADIAAQDAILKVIEESGKDCLVYSEELEKPKQFGSDSSVEIVVDPLDGSLDFLKGIRYFCGTGILILKNRKVINSFVRRLNDNKIFYCDKKNAYLNGKIITLSKEVVGKPYICLFAPYKDMLTKQFPKLFKLKDEACIYNNGGMFHCCDMLLGKYDAVGESDKVPLHEFPGAVIAEKAGAILSRLDGKPVVYDPNIKQAYIVSRNRELHEKVTACFI